MKVSDLFSDRDDFASEEKIIESIRRSKNFDPATEDSRRADALLIFSTSKQHTWLVATTERLYCIRDDLRQTQPRVNWSMQRRQLVSNGRIIATIRSRPRSEESGLLDISERHRDWLYTKRLFRDSSIEENVRALITSQMIR
jgi:hypothetical protein